MVGVGLSHGAIPVGGQVAMTFNEFVDALKELRGAGYTPELCSGGIRIYAAPGDTDNCFCPITAVLHHKQHIYMAICNFPAAANVIGLDSTQLANDIVSAADFWDADWTDQEILSMRDQMLAALGLDTGEPR